MTRTSAYRSASSGPRPAERDQVGRADVAYLLRAGSLRSCHQASASADGRAYLARLATDVWPLEAVPFTMAQIDALTWALRHAARCREDCARCQPNRLDILPGSA